MGFRYRLSDETVYWCTRVDRQLTDDERPWWPREKRGPLVSSDIPLHDPRNPWTQETLTPALPSWWWDEVEGSR